MKYTVDTNIFLNGLLEKRNCQEALREFTNSSESFFSRKVSSELASKKSEWALILKMLVKKVEPNGSIKEAYSKLSDFIGDSENEIMNISNLIDYLERKRLNMKNFDLGNEITRTLSYLGGFLALQKPIYPTKEMFEIFSEEFKVIRNKIEKLSLVDGSQDAKVIQELYLVSLYFSEEIKLLTENIKDFKISDPNWELNLSKIKIAKP